MGAKSKKQKANRKNFKKSKVKRLRGYKKGLANKKSTQKTTKKSTKKTYRGTFLIFLV